MKTRFKTSPKSQKEAILKNSNFLNNQNYVLGNIKFSFNLYKDDFKRLNNGEVIMRKIKEYNIESIKNIKLNLFLFFFALLAPISFYLKGSEIWEIILSSTFLFFMLIILLINKFGYIIGNRNFIYYKDNNRFIYYNKK